MNEYYLRYHIRANAELNLAADFWIPTVDISWDMHGKQFHQRLTGPSGFFVVIEEALTYAIEMARTWIDAQIKSSRRINETSVISSDAR
jgi:hypothetical protein